MDASLNGPSGRTTLSTTVLTIGRSNSNQLVVSDPKTSSRHAEIRPEGQDYTLTDLGSTNGTFVNGQRLEHNQPRLLRTGDIIRIGDTNFTYEGAAQIPPTVYVKPGQGNDPAYVPTIAVPPPAYAPTVAVPPPVLPEYRESQNPPQEYPVRPRSANGQSAGIPPVPSYTPAPQPKKSRKGLWITLGIVGGIALVIFAACAIIGFANRPTPAKALDSFCNNLEQQNNHAAYNQFSPGLQSQFAEATFNQFLTFDKVQTCTHTPPDTTGDSATSILTLHTASGRTVNYTAMLFKDDNGDWKISKFQRA